MSRFGAGILTVSALALLVFFAPSAPVAEQPEMQASPARRSTPGMSHDAVGTNPREAVHSAILPSEALAKEGPQSAIASPGRTIRGHLTPPGRAKSAFLWERASDRKAPVTIDPKTGTFEAKELPLGIWDLVVETPWGRLEGVDMTPILSEYDALIPAEYRTEDLGLPAKGAFTDEDRQWIERQVLEVKRYESRVRILALRGTADVAVVLVELTQEQPFVGEKGDPSTHSGSSRAGSRGDEVTWRIEKWVYEKKYGGWVQFRTRVLYRRRVPRAEWQVWGWQFEPALGGFAITEDRTEPVTIEFEIPDRPDPAKGLAGDKSPSTPAKVRP